MSTEREYARFLEQEYLKLNPCSRRLYEAACKVMKGGNTRTALFYFPYPVYMKRGEGSHIWDVDGNERIDFNYNNTVLILGHNHPKIVKAVKQQLEYGTVLGGPTEAEIKLAEKLIERIPSVEMVRFTPSGTEAILQALRLARSYTGREKIAKCEGAYHGTYDAVDISVFPPLKEAGPPSSPNSIPFNEGVTKGVLDNTIVMPYNNAEAVENIVKKHKDELAAILIEPIQRGYPAKKEFLEAVREITERYGILLIFDEVITYRISSGGAQEFFKVTPDITVLGKLIGGGFPIGAYGANEEIMETFAFTKDILKTRLKFSGTFNAFPVAMAAGLATLKELTPKVYECMNQLAENMRNGLAKILEDLGIEVHAEGIGSMFHIWWTKEEVFDYRSLMTSALRLDAYFDLDSLNRGAYYRGHPNVSAVTTKDDVKKALRAAEQSFASLKSVIREIAPHLIVH